MEARTLEGRTLHALDYRPETWPNDRWPNFSYGEMACSETGACQMDPQTMDRLQLLRAHYGHPLVITSGYRSPKHSREVAKPAGPGAHAQGRAIDIQCAGVEAYQILTEALVVGFTGLGVKQRGEGRFLHLDDLGPREHTVPRPALWSY